MPIYEYKCENGHVFDVMQKLSDEPLTACVECGAPVRKVLHPVNISFKGSGFYSTDYGRGNKRRDGKEAEGAPERPRGANRKAEKTPAKPPSGTITLNEPDAVTLTSTGGHVSNGAHAFYFAYQEIDTGNFSFSARIASVAGMSIGTGTTYRFGLMARQGLNAGEMLNDLDAWAEIGFYANTEAVLVGSHARLKSMSNGGGVSRANIFDLEVGHWVRMDIFDDGEQKRIAHLYSIDGVNWTQLSSTTDFAAYSNSSYWLVGLFAAVGQNHVAVEFDSITIEPL
jgi:putative FmdB family regulatory protein